MNRRCTGLALVFVIVFLFPGGAGCHKKALVAISHQRPRVELPAEIQTIAVVYDASQPARPPFKADSPVSGSRTYVENYAPMVANRIGTLLGRRDMQDGLHVQTVLRGPEMQRVLDEHKLQRSDLVRPGAAAEYGKLIGADALVVIDCTVEVTESQWGVERAVGENRRQVFRAVGRQICPSGRVRIELFNGSVLCQRTIRAEPKREELKPNFVGFLARHRDFSEMPPVDRLVAPVLEEAADEFVRGLLGGARTVSIPLESSRNKHCRAGVELIERGEYEAARSAFELALVGRSADDYQAHFGLGLIAEKSGNLLGALTHYRQALVVKERDDDEREDDDGYIRLSRRAIERVSDALDSNGSVITPVQMPQQARHGAQPSGRGEPVLVGSVAEGGH